MTTFSLNSEFIQPQYDSACFAHLPQTISYLMTGQGSTPLSPSILADIPQNYDTLIFFFIDSFGWRFFEKYANGDPFLQHLVKEGVVTKLTSQFPSTTAAHDTCIHSGLPVGQSGIYEWQYYEPTLDALFAPFLFSYAGDSKRDGLKDAGLDLNSLYPTQTLYQALQTQGISSYVLQHQEYTPSTYTNIVSAGAELIPYRTLPEALVNLQILLAQQQRPTYYFLYFDKVDALSHQYGPTSPQLEAEIETLLLVLAHLFLGLIKGGRKKTLFMLTADHGQVEVDPETTIYLNQAPRFAGLERYLKRNRKGELLVPAGSARDMFLYVKEGLLDEAQHFLRRGLEGQAEVHQVQDLIEAGLFGPPPLCAAFLERVGNLVILPYAGETVWWYEKDKFEQTFYGHHGGLTRAEMEIPLLMMPL